MSEHLACRLRCDVVIYVVEIWDLIDNANDD